MTLVVATAAVLLLGVLPAVMNGGRRGSSHRRRPGAGAVGAVYDLLNEDKRRAIELIVEDRAEEVDPERATGRPPSLAAGAARLTALSREAVAKKSRE
jgi:hypothetical protein